MCAVYVKLTHPPHVSVGLQYFANLQKKKKKKLEPEIGMAHITRFSTIQAMHVAIRFFFNYMAVISQNALSLIIAPPSCGNSQQ